MCYHWVSDQGSHFKNEVIAELKHALGAHHHFTTARCPWANGTVESAMKTTLKAFRALLSEWLMQPDQWRLIVPVVMLVLNQSPSDTLGGVAPITAMTGIRAMSPLDRIPSPAATKVTTLHDLLSWRNDDMAAMATALDKMHATVLDAATRKRQKNRKIEEKRCGNGTVRRGRFCADDALEVTDELLRHIAHNADSQVIDQFLDCRYNNRMASFEMCVHWCGLQAIEDSWEPAANLLEDIPTEFKRYVRSNKAEPQVKAMAAALGVTQSLGGFVANLPFAEPLNPSQESIQVFH
ncbi:hypothetical protein H257_19007 [Aphanomyces astaci]|uniref:Chromo domain-containing protein n=1 Tax=Aphanomyces astaci TaxID=112090 RepID=W4FB87_APHAT|nr:hypothetical protein H257_19007 [Aphanomyces astaci]ETV64051.1 hypothetical protein H257_19007 [Aphanomyces astaci]|eukprot:XP_009846466.1 hypothetical protein H257_19007 [Aphanomyces astaci]